MKRPRTLYIASAVCFALFIGGLQSEGKLGGETPTGKSNSLVPVFAFLWPTLLVAAIVWSIVRSRRRRNT